MSALSARGRSWGYIPVVSGLEDHKVRTAAVLTAASPASIVPCRRPLGCPEVVMWPRETAGEGRRFVTSVPVGSGRVSAACRLWCSVQCLCLGILKCPSNPETVQGLRSREIKTRGDRLYIASHDTVSLCASEARVSLAPRAIPRQCVFVRVRRTVCLH